MLSYCGIIASVSTLMLLRYNTYKRLNYYRELQLESIAKTDPLTKSNNRLACNSIVTKLCQDGIAFSIILFDLDDFKGINDAYGHICGDNVLVNVAKTASNSIRRNDTLIRWGGEEFVIILNETSINSAISLAERIRCNIELIEFENIDSAVTASFGVTEYIKGDSMQSVIGRADKYLYEAKEKGKNNVMYGLD